MEKKLFFCVLILIVCAIAVVIALSLSGCMEKKGKEIRFGALLPLTGDLSSAGEASQIALQIAVKDVNQYLFSIGSEITVKLIIEDTKTDTAVALEKLKRLKEKDVGIVIGPQSSAEVKAVREYAEENDILLISPSSTSLSLSIHGDNVFRFCPDDTHQAEAIAKQMWEDGVRVVVPIRRGDVWGDDLFQLTKNEFEVLGGKVVYGVRYNPTTRDFSTELQSLNLKIDKAIAQYGDADSVAVHLIAFDEVVPIFIQVGQEQSAIFSSIKWYGSDGTALNNALITNPQSARFAVTTGFSNPLYGEKEELEKYGLIKKQIQEKIGRDPDTYAIIAYDALWVATLASLAPETENTNADALKNALVQTAESYNGATGRIALNEAGDRMSGDYDFWAIKEEEDEGTFKWKKVAVYHVNPDGTGLIFHG